MTDSRSRFKVAVFGLSGSGKTTAARNLAARTHGIFWIEASRDLIEGQEFDKNLSFDDRTRQGIEYFRQACHREGYDWAARRISRISEGHDCIVVTGVRGYENLQKLRELGFFCVYMSTNETDCAKRLSMREGITVAEGAKHIQDEEVAFKISEMEAHCDHILDATRDEWSAECDLFNICMTLSTKSRTTSSGATCERCMIPKSLAGRFAGTGTVCLACQDFSTPQIRLSRSAQIDDIISDAKSDGRRALLGFSGGKDSMAAFLYLRQKAVPFETFTVDMGYYPITMLSRAKQISRDFECEHHYINGREFITDEMTESYELTATLYESVDFTTPHDFLDAYLRSRVHYSCKDLTPAAFPRVCVLCRKAVIRAYYEIAIRNSAKYVFLGINEWATLSSSETAELTSYSGVRKLQPKSSMQPVYVVHLPYAINSSLSRNLQALQGAGWQVPRGEQLVETNSNSCLLAKASEMKFHKMLGFHPDVTRLSREVTVGFLHRGEAIRALTQISDPIWTVRQTLEYANILGR